MTASKKITASGASYLFYGFLNEHGYLQGNLPQEPASGAAGSGMGLLEGVKSASPVIPEPDTEQVTGDDGLISEYEYDSIDTRRFSVEMAIMDMDVDAAILGITLEQIAEIIFGALDIQNPPEYDMCYIIQSRAQKQSVGSKGRKAWSGQFIPLASSKPLNRAAFAERTGAVYNMSVTPQMAFYDAWGVTIQSSTIGTDALRYRPFSSEYPIHVKRFTGTGALSTFTLDYEPVSVAKTSVFVRRVPATVNSISAGSKTFTLASAPADGAEIVVVYQFNG